MDMKINVRVTPNSKRNSVKRLDETHYKVWVTAPPEQGKATAVMIKLLAKQLNVAPSLMTVVTGATSRNKVLEIE